MPLVNKLTEFMKLSHGSFKIRGVCRPQLFVNKRRFGQPIRYRMAVNPRVQSAILKITLRAITGWIRKQAKVQEVTGPVET